MVNRKGFSLVEILVVVLIVGILGAVALPQYQAAVIKSKLSTLMPMVRAIASAEERHYLAIGEYAANVSDLDVNFPSNFTCSGTYCRDRKDWSMAYQLYETSGAMRVIGFVALNGSRGSQVINYVYHVCPTKEICKGILSSYGSIKYFEVTASGSEKDLLIRVAVSMGGKRRSSGSDTFLL